ncbi:MAG: VWA domain-containing protein [Desulfobacterales bacterium]
MLTLAHPWLLAVLPLPLILRRLLPAYGEQRPALRIPFFQRWTAASGATPAQGAVVPRRSLLQAILLLVTWGAVVTALARPQWLEPPIVNQLPTRDLLLAVDLSVSMEARDFTNRDGQTVDRLTAVKEVLDEFLTRRQGDRVGLIVFGTAAFVQVPFTQDLEVSRQLLAETEVAMAGPKTALGDAIGLGISLFERSEIPQRVMIALTDGNDTGSRVPPHEAARIAADKGIVIHTVAIGDPAAVGEEKLDEEALRQVAQISKGEYYFAGDRDQLEEIYADLDRLETRQVETVSFRPRRDLFHWPLGLIAVLFLVYHGLLATGRFSRATSDKSLK